MYGCESWTAKKAEHWRIDAFELWCWSRLLRVPWTARRSNQFWIFIRRTDAETEAPILWPSDAKSWLIGKDPDSGKDWRQEEKGMTEDMIDGWYHWLNGHEFEKALGVGEGQGSLACCNISGCKESDTTEQLNSNNKYCLWIVLWWEWETLTCSYHSKKSFVTIEYIMVAVGFHVWLLVCSLIWSFYI